MSLFSVGSELLLLIPDESNERVLHPGKVVESSAETIVARFELSEAPAVETDVNAFGESRGRFFQQGARVIEIREPGPKPLIAFARCGEPVSAENRQTFRVVTLAAGIFAKIGNDCDCEVVDISAEGFAAIVKSKLKLGSVVPVEFSHDGSLVSAPVRVQTIKVRPDGKVRYGFLASDRTSAARKSLQQITGAIQRAQLRRLSGAA